MWRLHRSRFSVSVSGRETGEEEKRRERKLGKYIVIPSRNDHHNTCFRQRSNRTVQCSRPGTPNTHVQDCFSREAACCCVRSYEVQALD